MLLEQPCTLQCWKVLSVYQAQVQVQQYLQHVQTQHYTSMGCHKYMAMNLESKKVRLAARLWVIS